MPRLQSANFAVTVLTSGVSALADSFEVDDASAFPQDGPFMILVHDNTPSFEGVREIMEVGSVDQATNIFSDILRGRENTVDVVHEAGSRVECVWTAGTHGELADDGDVKGLEYSELSSFATNIDDEGVYKNIAWKRKDSTLYAESTLIGSYPYSKVKIEYYDDAGTVVIKTITWDLTYDDDDFPYIKEVV